jgi:hypothetical protein
MKESERNALRRVEYQIRQREAQQARQFAVKIARFLNGEIGLQRDRVRVDWHEEAACGRWLAEFLRAWEQAGYRWSRWPHRAKIEANFSPSLTEGGEWPKLAIRLRPAAPIQGDLPMIGGPELEDEEIGEILEESAEEDGWRQAVITFIEYMTGPAFNALRRCERPACGRYFARDRANQTFCSDRCAKAEARKHSTANARAGVRKQMLEIVQTEIDRVSRMSFTRQRTFLANCGRKWQKGVAAETKRFIEAGLDPVESNWVTRAVRIGELKPPHWKPRSDDDDDSDDGF